MNWEECEVWKNKQTIKRLYKRVKSLVVQNRRIDWVVNDFMMIYNLYGLLRHTN